MVLYIFCMIFNSPNLSYELLLITFNDGLLRESISVICEHPISLALTLECLFRAYRSRVFRVAGLLKIHMLNFLLNSNYRIFRL